MEKCTICGHTISATESIERGIGGECLAAIRAAKKTVALRDEEISLQYRWVIAAEIWRNRFISMFSDTKFRSEFKKSFYESMKATTRISRKQLDIMIEQIEARNYGLCGAVLTEIDHAKETYLNSVIDTVEISAGLIETARRIIRN